MKLLRISIRLFAGLLFTMLLLPALQASAASKCVPTPQDEIGPFYRPNAPVRSTIGKGYLLEGTVRDASSCRPVAGARIEFWQAGPGGAYDDAHRRPSSAIRMDATALRPPFLPPMPEGRRISISSWTCGAMRG